MRGPGPDGDDDELFDELKAAVAGPPEAAQRMRDAARAAFSWRTVDAELELLALAYDSALDDHVAVRQPTLAARRMVVFEGESLSVGVEVGEDVLTGQLIPAQAGHITLLTPHGWSGETEGDDAGYFLLARPQHGPVRLECRTPAGRLATEWVAL